MAHGGYGAPSIKMSSLAGDGVLLVGGEGGWIIGHSLVIGGAGYGSATNVVAPQSLQSPAGDARLSIGYGGLRLGGILHGRRVAHATLGVLVGGGRAASASSDANFRRSDGFFAVEPDLGIELNLATHLRLAMNGSYRFVGSTDGAGFTTTRLSGPGASIALRFGEF